jgi:hypothetical protein
MVDPLGAASIARSSESLIRSALALDPSGLLKMVPLFGEYFAGAFLAAWVTAATSSAESTGAGSAWLVGPSTTSMVSDVMTATAASAAERSRRSDGLERTAPATGDCGGNADGR